MIVCNYNYKNVYIKIILYAKMSVVTLEFSETISTFEKFNFLNDVISFTFNFVQKILFR